MAIIKCKMCGGDLEILEGASVCECEYCGTKQTVPKVDDEKKIKLFERANRLRTACEFDKAAGVYESIVADFDQEAEAYWGLILCKFGIEYVDDPATGNKVPTCHRSSFDSLMDDPNFDMVMECADPVARRVYRDEAKQIEELRKGIIDVSAKEEPYDVFISYKELGDEGQRTLDSVIAQDIYTELTDKGYRVFFSRISLEDKLGVEYEPYIFAALNSAKVMLVVGTDYDYFNAVWVKNEWSRFLALIASGQKKTLIPVFKGIDVYDMPKEFNKLAAQDMGKIGAMQDLIRGVEKIVGQKQAAAAPQPVVTQPYGPSTDSLLKRAQLYLEDSDWANAASYSDKVLDIDPENAEAYLCKALAKNQSLSPAALSPKTLQSFRDDPDYRKFRKFNTRPELAKEIESALSSARERAAQEAEADAMREAGQAAARAAFRARIAPAQGVISAARECTVGLRADGTAVAVGYNHYGQCNVSDWIDIVAIATGRYHTVGLRKNGTVVAVGSNEKGECNVSAWKDIVAVSVRGTQTVGLRKNGTVLAVGSNEQGECNVSAWKDIVAIAAGGDHTVGLRADGTVVAVGNNQFGACNVSAWKDIVAIAADIDRTVGLHADGTVEAVGLVGSSLRHKSGWSDIVAISVDGAQTIGLRADGSVVAAGENNRGQCDVSGWKDIVAVAAGGDHTVGLCADGTVVAIGYNLRGQCKTESWKLFQSVDTLEAERKAAVDRAEAERIEAAERAKGEIEKSKAWRKSQIEKLGNEKKELHKELSNIKGLFSNRRRKEIEARLEEIEMELNKPWMREEKNHE